MHLDLLQAIVLGLAALITAWGVIYRGLVLPLVRAMRRLADALAALHESTLMVREVVQYVGGFVVHTEDRLVQLETVVGVEPPVMDPAYQRHRNALDWLERNARRRDRRLSEDKKEPKS